MDKAVMRRDAGARPTVATAALTRLSALGKPGRILGPEVDTLRAGRLAATGAWRERMATASWAPAVRRHVYGRIWTDAARQLGAQVHELDHDLLSVERGDAATVVSHQQVRLDNAVDLLIALHRRVVHERLRRAGVPVPSYAQFEQSRPHAARAFVNAAEAPCVVKPASGTSGGDGVTCGVDTVERFERARLWARRWDPARLIVEAQASGDEYRLLFLDAELLGIVRRRPPRVVGDGRSSVMELLAAENRRRAETDGRAGMSPIGVDLDCVFALQHAGFSLRSVLPSGGEVAVKTMVNQSGARDTDTVSCADVSAELVDEAATAARAVGVRLASVEVITPDLTRSLRDAGGVVLEVNGTPGLHYHYVVSDPASAVPVAVPILAKLLGLSVVGGVTTTTRLRDVRASRAVCS
jgi:cyanophycin synthetase